MGLGQWRRGWEQQVHYQMDWLIDSHMAWLDAEIMNVSTSAIYISSIARY